LEKNDIFIEGTPFKWEEAIKQGSTGEIVIPTPTQHDNIIKQAHALLPVYNMLGGFTITSWLRSESHNKAIGGAPKSAHLLGLATDFVPTHCGIEEAKKKIQAVGLYPGGGEIDTTTWIHLDLVHKQWFYAKAPK
jgi:hypothetical protein